MKRLLMILTILFALPFTVFASDVKITKIEVLDKTGSTETRKSTFDGMTANLNFDVVNAADSVKYKITIQNDGDKVFNIDLKDKAEQDKYFDYIYSGDTKIEPGKTGSITVEVILTRSLLKDDINNDTYDSNLTLNIVSDEVTSTPKKKPEKKNPETGLASKAIIICSAGVVLMGISLYLNTKHKSKFKAYMFLPLLVIPILMEANAAEKLTININSKIINKPFIFRYEPYVEDEFIMGDDDSPDLFEIHDSNIIEYEIPRKYIKDYYKEFMSFEDQTEEEIMELLKLEFPIFETEEEVNEFKKQATEPTGYMYLLTTSRTITVYAHAYDPTSKIDEIEIVLEFDRETKKVVEISASAMNFNDLMDYMISTTETVITYDGDSEKYIFPDGAKVDWEELENYVISHIDSFKEPFFIIHDNYDKTVFSTKGGKNADRLTDFRIGTLYDYGDDDISYSSRIYKYIKTTDKYYERSGRVTNGSFIYDADIIVYRCEGAR